MNFRLIECYEKEKKFLYSIRYVVYIVDTCRVAKQDE